MFSLSFPRVQRPLAARVATAYVLVACTWILFSDRALAWMVKDPAQLLTLSIAKGWLFVLLTGWLLYAYLSIQADARLSLLEATLQARVAPCRWSKETGRWEFARESARLLGQSPEALAPPGALERHLHPGDLHRLARARVTALAGGAETFEARFHTEDGRELWTQWTLRAAPGGLQGVVQDVSEIHETRTLLLCQQRRELVSLMAGGLAHDLKNLLQAIRGSAEILENSVPASEVHLASTIVRAADRANELAQRQLRLMRDERMDSSVLADLNSQISEAAQLLHLAVPKSMEIRLEVAPDLPKARFDGGQILQVLMNLGLNAKDAQGDTGRIHLRTGRGRLPGEMGEHLYAEVADEGPGIPPEVQARLFEPYYTTKTTGNGLGLATAQSIARAHGGRLTFESEAGQGTRFRLWLPLEAPSEMQAGSAS